MSLPAPPADPAASRLRAVAVLRRAATLRAQRSAEQSPSSDAGAPAMPAPPLPPFLAGAVADHAATGHAVADHAALRRSRSFAALPGRSDGALAAAAVQRPPLPPTSLLGRPSPHLRSHSPPLPAYEPPSPTAPQRPAVGAAAGPPGVSLGRSKSSREPRGSAVAADEAAGAAGLADPREQALRSLNAAEHVAQLRRLTATRMEDFRAWSVSFGARLKDRQRRRAEAQQRAEELEAAGRLGPNGTVLSIAPAGSGLYDSTDSADELGGTSSVVTTATSYTATSTATTVALAAPAAMETGRADGQGSPIITPHGGVAGASERARSPFVAADASSGPRPVSIARQLSCADDPLGLLARQYAQLSSDMALAESGTAAAGTNARPAAAAARRRRRMTPTH